MVFARQLRGGDDGELDSDLFTVPADGGTVTRLTRDHRSMRPEWGARGIAYERIAPLTSRTGHPAVNLVQPGGTGMRLLARSPHSVPIEGFWPIAWSRDGTRLVLNDDGDSTEGWAVNLTTGRARDLTGRRDDVSADGISADGRTVLVEGGRGGLSTMPFAGGRQTSLGVHWFMAGWSWSGGP